MPGNYFRYYHRIIVWGLKYFLIKMTSCPHAGSSTKVSKQKVWRKTKSLNPPRYFGSFLKSFILRRAGSFIDDPRGIFDSVSADSILFISVLNGPSAQTDCIPFDVKATNNLVWGKYKNKWTLFQGQKSDRCKVGPGSICYQLDKTKVSLYCRSVYMFSFKEKV